MAAGRENFAGAAAGMISRAEQEFLMRTGFLCSLTALLAGAAVAAAQPAFPAAGPPSVLPPAPAPMSPGLPAAEPAPAAAFPEFAAPALDDHQLPHWPGEADIFPYP